MNMFIVLNRLKMMKHIVTLLAIATLVCCQPESYFTVPTATWTRTSSGGLRFSIPDSDGISLVGLHYNINQPLAGVAAGEWNVDITSKTGNEWVSVNDKVTVKEGDTIHFWLLVISNGAGYQETDQSYKLEAPTTTRKPTTATTTVTTPTTKHTGPPGNHTTPSTPPPVTEPPSGGNGSCPCTGGGGADLIPTCKTYPCIVFEDNFDTLDFTKWQHELTAGGGGNWEFQYYVNNRSNSYVKDGSLYLKPTLTTDTFRDPNFLQSGTFDLWGSSPANLCTGGMNYGCFRQGNGGNILNPVQSARIRTVDSFNFKYGKVEVEAKMPEGDWIWPAIWMVPMREEYGKWPASGEIDIVEVRGNKDFKLDGESIGVDQMGSTMHWGPYFGNNQYLRTHKTKNLQGKTFADDFHKYGVEWDENSVQFFLDGEQILKVDPGPGGFWKFGEFDTRTPGSDNPWRNGTRMAPFDKEMYLIINVAVGGTAYFPDAAQNSPSAKPWSNKSPTASLDFWNAKAQWYPTWNADKNNGESAAMKVNYIKVWKMKPNPN
ncbi:unnamed protein product [Owenia fusiformis]|uniref:Uncharacterized protein n=1 Tax=Owenia fusiformis TaxID=6347 RepID=A0A8J1U0Z3_OWEFU|nr:unnamed protein product [Owenia fusiformis]